MQGKISAHVLDAYKSAGGDSVELEPFSFTKCKTLLHEILKSGIKLRIMIDALDECDKPKELLQALKDVSQDLSRDMPDALQLLVASRHEVNVKDKFSNAVIVDLSPSVSNTDMETYIKTEVSNRPDDQRLLKGKCPEIEKMLIDILCRRAGGMYNESLNCY